LEAERRAAGLGVNFGVRIVCHYNGRGIPAGTEFLNTDEGKAFSATADMKPKQSTNTTKVLQLQNLGSFCVPRGKYDFVVHHFL
jgi:hypothetical protein